MALSINDPASVACAAVMVVACTDVVFKASAVTVSNLPSLDVREAVLTLWETTVSMVAVSMTASVVLDVVDSTDPDVMLFDFKSSTVAFNAVKWSTVPTVAVRSSTVATFIIPVSAVMSCTSMESHATVVAVSCWADSV